MLKYYGRVREEDYRKVTRHKPVQSLLQNEAQIFDSTKTAEIYESPLKTRENGEEKLTVYSTVYSLEQSVIRRQGEVMTLTPTFTQALEYIALSGKKRPRKQNWGAPCGTPQIGSNGEDRI